MHGGGQSLGCFFSFSSDTNLLRYPHGVVRLLSDKVDCYRLAEVLLQVSVLLRFYTNDNVNHPLCVMWADLLPGLQLPCCSDEDDALYSGDKLVLARVRAGEKKNTATSPIHLIFGSPSPDLVGGSITDNMVRNLVLSVAGTVCPHPRTGHGSDRTAHKSEVSFRRRI